MQSNDKKIVKNTIFLYLRMIVVLGISLFTTREVLHILGVENFGIYNVVAGFVSMFAFLSTMMSNSTLRFYNNRIGAVGEDGIKAVYNISTIIQGLLFIVILILLETVGLWYINYQMVIPAEKLATANWLFQFSIISMGIAMMDVPFRACILAHERMDFFAIVSVTDAVLKLGIVYLLLLCQGDQLKLYGLLPMGISCLNLLLDCCFCRSKYKQIRLDFNVEKPLFKEMFSFLGWSAVGNFSFMMKEQGVNMVLNLFFGPVVNAARGVTMQVVSALQQFVSNNNVAVAPQMAQSYAKGDYERSVNLFMTVSKLNFVLFVIVALPVGLEIDYILGLWLGGNVPEHTPAFVLLVLVCSIINNWNSPLSNLVYATGKMKNYQLASLIVLLAVPLSYVAFMFGACAEWAFILTIIVSATHHTVGLLILRHLLPFSMRKYAKDVVLPALAVLLIAPIVPLGCRYLMDVGFLRLVVVTVVSVGCVIGGAYYIYLNKDEREGLLSLVMRRMKKH